MSFSYLAPSATVDYNEQRHHELRKTIMSMVDGNLVKNQTEHKVGTSSRVAQQGYWGFASSTMAGKDIATALSNKAFANAQAMSVFGEKSNLLLPTSTYQGEHSYRGKTPLSQQECMGWLNNMHQFCKNKYPKLVSSSFILSAEHHSKYLSNSYGSQALNSIQRAMAYVFFTAEDKDGQPVELMEAISGKGSHADLNLSLTDLEPVLDQLYQHLMAKTEAVPARGGKQTVVMASDLTGILAHEAMGHPCEADLVLGGAVTGDLQNQRVASDLITMVDIANTYEGRETLVPVYADDEGVPAEDVVLIENGVLKNFMHSRETAGKFDARTTGNARAYGTNDEPLIRMRNTAILPGTDSVEQMISEIDDGYLLIKTGNGQADTTTEFMFGINLGYEIKNGKLGRAIKDTTLSGSAIDVLKSVDAVSSDMKWECSGYCGKKQPMVVSTGGPSLRAVAHLGGE